MPTHNHHQKLAIAAWCLYDWASTSYVQIVITFIFATYFTTKIAVNQIVGTFQWANAASIAGLIIALSSPLVGAIADYRGQHKLWLFIFTYITVFFTALLWFAYPNHQSIYFTLICVVISTVAYEVAQVFYNAFLPALAPRGYLGRISGISGGCGYVGGIVALSIALIFFVKSKGGWLDHTNAEHIRICGPFVALWYGLFALPLFFFVPPIATTSLPLLKATTAGFRELSKTIRKLAEEKNTALYLFSHMIYIDGLNTLFAFGGIYAAGTFGLSFEEVLLFGVMMNISAGVGAITLGWVDDYLGSKKTIIFSLIGLIIFAVPLLLMTSKYIFWSVGLLLSLFVGPVQTASRSMMVRLIISKNSPAEMFGLYALSGKITAFIGPWLLGVVTITFGSQRAGMATILLFFAIGALTLLPVKVEEGPINLG